MRDEFLFNCEKEIMEANLSLMCGQKEDGLKKIKKVSDDIMQEIGNSIHPFLAMEMKKICKDNSELPALVLRNASIEAAKDINNYVTPCSNITVPITVAALRYVADIIEKELLDVEQAEIAKMTQETLHESTKVTKEEKRDE